MKIYKEVMVPQQKEAGILCNVCGIKIDNTYDALGLSVQLFSMFGYGSNYDGQVHQADICELCYDDFRKGWKIPPTIEG